MPGYPKSSIVSGAFFRYCLHDLLQWLEKHAIPVFDDEAICSVDAAGDFYLVPFTTLVEVNRVKMLAEKFEKSHPHGRFLDVDITSKEGNPVSSGESKLCFFCGERPAIECRRQNRHNIDELRSFMFGRMKDYCADRREKRIVKQVSALAARAVMAEISLTPKPGLVDRHSSGSHRDMNYQTFQKSTEAIVPWFARLVEEGFRYKADDLSKALPLIRSIGLKMEEDMFAATNGVNTQKGLIFLLGIGLFACGNLLAGSNSFDSNRFRDIVKQICAGITARELENNSRAARTHGEKVYRAYGFTGARGEAEMGYPVVFAYGLPVLQAGGEVNDEALIKTLLSIAAHNNDTNILHRGGSEALNTFKQLAAAAYEDFSAGNYNQIITWCHEQQISPGGAADLLVMSIFIHSLTKSVFDSNMLPASVNESELYKTEA